jgi:hypothetical protein
VLAVPSAASSRILARWATAAGAWVAPRAPAFCEFVGFVT